MSEAGKLKDYILKDEGYSFNVAGKHNGKDYTCTITRKDDTFQIEIADISNFDLTEVNEIIDYLESMRDSYPTA